MLCLDEKAFGLQVLTCFSTKKVAFSTLLLTLHLPIPLTCGCRCGNINWAKRTKCNICNTNKPGHNEGGVRYCIIALLTH